MVVAYKRMMLPNILACNKIISVSHWSLQQVTSPFRERERDFGCDCSSLDMIIFPIYLTLETL